jgi:hypothetical protein
MEQGVNVRQLRQMLEVSLRDAEVSEAGTGTTGNKARTERVYAPQATVESNVMVGAQRQAVARIVAA